MSVTIGIVCGWNHIKLSTSDDVLEARFMRVYGPKSVSGMQWFGFDDPKMIRKCFHLNSRFFN